MRRLTLYDQLSWHCDQLRMHLKKDDLALAEAHCRSIRATIRSALLTHLTQISQDTPGGYR